MLEDRGLVGEGALSASIHYIASDQPNDLTDLSLSLELLWERFNRHYDYPVLIFHEGLDASVRARLRDASENRVWFLLMDEFWPRGHTRDEGPGGAAGFHALSGNPHHYTAGYRAMCEYNAGTMFRHPVFERLDYTMHLDTDSYLAADVPTDVFRILEDTGLVYGAVATKVAHAIQDNHLFDVTVAYMELNNIDPRGNTFLAHLISEDMNFQGQIFMNDFEIVKLEPFRDPKGKYQDYFRFLQALDGFWNHGWHNSLMTTLAVAMFFSDKTTLLPVPYAHQMDCKCGESHQLTLTCVIRIPGHEADEASPPRERQRLQESTAYLRKVNVGGLLECWPPERLAAAVCEEHHLQGLLRCVG
jgi:hypothetical protein